MMITPDPSHVGSGSCHRNSNINPSQPPLPFGRYSVPPLKLLPSPSSVCHLQTMRSRELDSCFNQIGSRPTTESGLEGFMAQNRKNKVVNYVCLQFWSLHSPSLSSSLRCEAYLGRTTDLPSHGLAPEFLQRLPRPRVNFHGKRCSQINFCTTTTGASGTSVEGNWRLKDLLRLHCNLFVLDYVSCSSSIPSGI